MFVFYLLQVQRLAQYEQYLEQLLSAQRDEQEEIARTRAQEKEVPKPFYFLIHYSLHVT